jgi:hypothetical protein
MNPKSRVASILKASSLDYSVTAVPTFDLSKLELPFDFEMDLPLNLRLGHLVEKIVGELLKSAANYELIHENTQIIEDKKTIGELDFIIQDNRSKQLIHVELAYKFYLFDPNISSELINCWIGPNRNDSLKEKLDKLKIKQLPLLYHDCTKSTLKTIAIEKVSQALCLLVNLFIPFEFKEQFSPVYEKAIKGYYINFETFILQHTENKTYYLPIKKEWGMEPSENETWINFESIKHNVSIHMKDKQALLCWQEDNGSFSQFFIVWW